MDSNSPYPPPAALGHPPSRVDLQWKATFWKRAIWCSGALFLFTPMVGVLITVIGMRNAFASLGSNGIGDPAALSTHIGEVLIVTTWSLMAWIPNLIFLILSIIRFLSFRTQLRDPASLATPKT